MQQNRAALRGGGHLLWVVGVGDSKEIKGHDRQSTGGQEQEPQWPLARDKCIKVPKEKTIGESIHCKKETDWYVDDMTVENE